MPESLDTLERIHGKPTRTTYFLPAKRGARKRLSTVQPLANFCAHYDIAPWENFELFGSTNARMNMPVGKVISETRPARGLWHGLDVGVVCG